MKKIIHFGASTSSSSINKTFAAYAAGQLKDIEPIGLDLNEFDAPMYSVDKEGEIGIPPDVVKFVELVDSADGLIISLAEHNGSYTAAFKSLFDWATRHKQKVWSETPMLLLSTSPGGRGASSVMEAAKGSFPHLGGNIVASFSLPSYNDNFSESEGITNPSLSKKFTKAISTYKAAIS